MTTTTRTKSGYTARTIDGDAIPIRSASYRMVDGYEELAYATSLAGRHISGSIIRCLQRTEDAGELRERLALAYHEHGCFGNDAGNAMVSLNTWRWMLKTGRRIARLTGDDLEDIFATAIDDAERIDALELVDAR